MKYLLFTLLMQLTLSVSAASGQPADDDYGDEGGSLPYVEIQYVSDFSHLAEIARSENKIILLEVSASYCDYCDLLEEEFIKPMLRNDDYAANVLIRKIDMDSYHKIIDFSGDTVTPYEFTRRLKLKLTPTLLFFDGSGNEVSKRILGINSLDLYGGYIDDALASGLQKIKSQ